MNSPTWILMACAALTFLGCASGLPIDRAIAVHNIYRSVLLDLDGAFVPVLKAADAEAQGLHPDDPQGYLDAMKPWETAVKALTAARQTELAMHLAIRQWEATGKEGSVLRETYACAADAVDKVSDAFGVLPRASPLYAAAFAISTQLRAQADGEECKLR